MVIAAAASISLEGVGCSTSYGVTKSWNRSLLEVQRVSDHSGISFRDEKPFFGPTQFHWLPLLRENCPSKLSVAADYSDSVPGSSNYAGHAGYHPLEELKDRKRVRDTKLTSAEIARTTIEANKSALLIFPGMVHCEPHENISWSEFHYFINEYGDMFFEISDDENLLQDREASNPVSALIAMDVPLYYNRGVSATEYNISESSSSDDISFDDYYFEVRGSDMLDIPVDWGVPDASNWVHPIYFSKCLTKAVNMEYNKKMDHPSNGVFILGCLRPASIDEEFYLRRPLDGEESDGYTSDWKDGEILSFSFRGDGNQTSSTIYRLEIESIELFSVYGVQSAINLQDFQDAEPDILVHSNRAIVDRFIEKGTRFDSALRALCRKKGLQVEGAKLIGVDSLGMDVRVFSGVEVQTYRFPFKVRATSKVAAEKQIQQLLFPRSHRKRFRTQGDGLGEPDSF